MLIHAGTACGIVGLKRPADHYAARAVAMTESGGHTEAGAYVWSIKALIEAHRGNWRGAVEANRIALARIREVGDFNLEAEVWQTRSAIHICEGNYGAAEAAWLRTRELGKRNGNPQVLCWSLLDEVETRIGRDEVDQAAAALEAALEVPTPEGDGSDAVEKHYATALVRAGQGRWGEAVHAADAVVDRVGRQPPAGFHWVDFCAGAVDVIFDSMENGGAFAADMRAELEAKAERGNKVVRRVSRQFGNVRPRRFVLQGLLEWQRGDHDGAIRTWRRSERLAARKDMPFERARARYEIARHGGAGSHRDAWLEDASDTFRALGASQMVRRVREAQAEGS
jgi:tetratricopeptide (TPR) repeat protein